MKTKIIALVSIAALSACDSRPLNELNYAEQQEILETFKATCAEQGISEGHSQYVPCVQAEINAENARRRRQAEGVVALGAGLSQMGDSYSAAAQANRPVTCTTSPAVGWGSTTTRCY